MYFSFRTISWKTTLIVRENQAQARATVIQRRAVSQVTDLQTTATALILSGRKKKFAKSNKNKNKKSEYSKSKGKTSKKTPKQANSTKKHPGAKEKFPIHGGHV